MTSDQIASLIDGSIPLVIGTYFTLLGYRIVGKKPGEDEDYDKKMEKVFPIFRILCPLVILFGIYQIVLALLQKQ